MSESELRILESLARYKYLTTSQLDLLNILKNKMGLYQRLRELRAGKKPLIANNSFGIMPGKGKLEDFYYLTSKGQDFLIENLEYNEQKIKAPKGTSSLFARDYFHRKETINFYIYFDKWINKNDGDILFLDYYFDKIGDNRSKKNLRAKNKIDIEQTGGYIIPDIVTKFTYKNEPYLFFIEQHNGKDTKKLLKQLYFHLLALEEGKGAEKYQMQKNHRVAVIFEFESILKATLERIQNINEFKGFEKFFIFKTNESLNKSFFNDWIDLKRINTNLI
ncbi:MAG: Unknown protein [uncultured Campylobacterales bacterium]|uniref:Replication-relaxation n=1 Tax=uncultured Campylobacterales bacterium TaxID=352960 RepID=A0A6S6SQW5_9BACT|nr:MAG: Unknown protein [uncultured Campylobacterales bacterium]